MDLVILKVYNKFLHLNNLIFQSAFCSDTNERRCRTNHGRNAVHCTAVWLAHAEWGTPAPQAPCDRLPTRLLCTVHLLSLQTNGHWAAFCVLYVVSGFTTCVLFRISTRLDRLQSRLGLHFIDVTWKTKFTLPFCFVSLYFVLPFSIFIFITGKLGLRKRN